jgi:YidC/Oxa1 family membrane protein insertase
VFLGLYHVLMSFNRTQHGIGRLGLDAETNRRLGNYVFSAADVNHFLDANLFGAPIGASMTQSAGSIAAFHEFNRMSVIAIGVPLMLLAGFATHMNSRASIARQSAEAAANPQTAIMNRLALYIFPVGVVVGGPFLPLAIILYWFANNIWTFGQQHYVFGKIAQEEEAKKQEATARRAANAPAPGAKPKRPPKQAAASSNDGAEITDSAGIEIPDVSTEKPTGEPTDPKAAGSNGAGSVGRTPRPGARPKKRKR